MSSYIYCDNEENGILSVVIEIMDNVFHFPHFNVQSFVASIDCLSNFKKKSFQYFILHIQIYVFTYIQKILRRTKFSFTK